MSISLSAIRRSDRKVVTILDKAPLVLSYGSSTQEDYGLDFELQRLLPALIVGRNFPDIGPYGPDDFPVRDLAARASLWPDENLEWHLGLEFCLEGDMDNSTMHPDTIAATPEDMLKLLSVANWQ